jgi:hypothetical protein
VAPYANVQLREGSGVIYWYFKGKDSLPGRDLSVRRSFFDIVPVNGLRQIWQELLHGSDKVTWKNRRATRKSGRAVKE